MGKTRAGFGLPHGSSACVLGLDLELLIVYCVVCCLALCVVLRCGVLIHCCVVLRCVVGRLRIWACSRRYVPAPRPTRSAQVTSHFSIITCHESLVTWDWALVVCVFRRGLAQMNALSVGGLWYLVFGRGLWSVVCGLWSVVPDRLSTAYCIVYRLSIADFSYVSCLFSVLWFVIHCL